MTLFATSQNLILAAVSHLTHLQSLVTWIKGDLGQYENLFNRAHIQGNMRNLMEQMVILAIRTLFVNSDCNHSHQHDISYVSVSFVIPRKTYWQQRHCKWSGEVHMSQWLWVGVSKPCRLRVSQYRCLGVGHLPLWETGPWLLQPDMECCEQDSWLLLQPVFQRR